jgi:hypothetical protein
MNKFKSVTLLCLVTFFSFKASCQDMTSLHVPLVKDEKVEIIFWKKVKKVMVMECEKCVKYDTHGQSLKLEYGNGTDCYLRVKLADNKTYNIKAIHKPSDKPFYQEYDFSELEGGEPKFTEALTIVEDQNTVTSEKINKQSVKETEANETSAVGNNTSKDVIDYISNEELTKQVDELIKYFNQGLNNIASGQPKAKSNEDIEFIFKQCFNKDLAATVITTGNNGRNPPKPIRDYLKSVRDYPYYKATFNIKDIQILNGFKRDGNKYTCLVSYIQNFKGFKKGPDGKKIVYESNDLKTATIIVEITEERDAHGNERTYYQTYLRHVSTEKL